MFQPGLLAAARSSKGFYPISSESGCPKWDIQVKLESFIFRGNAPKSGFPLVPLAVIFYCRAFFLDTNQILPIFSNGLSVVDGCFASPPVSGSRPFRRTLFGLQTRAESKSTRHKGDKQDCLRSRRAIKAMAEICVGAGEINTAYFTEGR